MRKTALFLCMCIFLSLLTVLPTFAATISVSNEVVNTGALTSGVNAVEGISNNSFERYTKNGNNADITSWLITCNDKVDGIQQNFLDSQNVKLSSDAKSGESAIELFAGSSVSVNLAASVKVSPGYTYELSAWVKTPSHSGTIYLHGQFFGQDADGNALTYARLNLYFQNPANGALLEKNIWTKKILRFTAPEGVTSLSIRPYLKGPGQVVWDDVSLLIPNEAVPPLDVPEKKEPVEGTSNLLKNSGFEDKTADTDFPKSGNTWTGHYAKAVNTYSHSGDISAKLTLSSAGEEPRITSSVTDIVPGATYQFSTFVLTPDAGTEVDFSFWVDYASSDTYRDAFHVGQSKKHWTLMQSTAWREIILEFTAPEDAKSAMVRIRLRETPGVFYADDVTFYMVKMPDYARVETDELFYYTEWETGVCHASANPYYGNALSGGKVQYTFLGLDGKTVLDQKDVSFVNEEAEYVFQTKWMTEKGKPYFVSAKVYDNKNIQKQDTLLRVYRFDRPTYMCADGVFRKNGKEYNLVLGNGANSERIELGPEKGGVTIVQLVADPSQNATTLTQRLDLAKKHGLLCMVNFYNGYICAGTESNIENTKAIVNEVMHHDALWGYKVQDEPYQKGNTAEEMERAYVTIRNLDPHHPIYLDDSVAGGYKWLYRYADVIDIDYYGDGSPDSGRIFTEKMEIANEATRGRKPFMLLQQAFINQGNPIPSVDAFRHYAYQAFFAGASGFGFHTLGIDGGGPLSFMEQPQWEEICSRWADWEIDFMFDCFVNRKYPQINAYMDENVMWRTYLVNRDIYAIILNREKYSEITSEIPLTDGEGKLQISDFTASRVAGANGESARVTGSETLSVTLGNLSAEVWKITPSHMPDTSHLKPSKYRDVDAYPWAYTAVAHLEDKGILNEATPIWFGSGEGITRGDFAMFLINTLKISGAKSDVFKDVDASKAYAEAISIGKGLGIFTDSGNNCFKPEDSLSMQEGMDMVSRAICVKKAALCGDNINLDSYPDAEIYGDWVALDGASLLRLNRLRGISDGKVEEADVLTRAEAAALLYRIMMWVNAPEDAVPLQKSAGNLSILERKVLYDSFLSENNTWSLLETGTDCMKATVAIQGETHYIFVNVGRNTVNVAKIYNKDELSPYLETLILPKENGYASYVENENINTNTLTLRLPPGGIALFAALDSLPSDCLYIQNLALLYLEDGAKVKLSNASVSALYTACGKKKELIKTVQNEETVFLDEGINEMKLFCWSQPLIPEKAVRTYRLQ